MWQAQADEIKFEVMKRNLHVLNYMEVSVS
jgi:hypothetical protein